MNLDAGVLVSRRFDNLKPLLRTWTRTAIQFSKENSGDAVYWCNERTSVGHFAASVWMAGGFSQEEYCDRKKGKPGRVDLWFKYRGKEYVAEAKFCYPLLTEDSESSAVRGQISRALRWALRDVKNCPPDGHPLGLVFVAPKVGRHTAWYECEKRFKKSLVCDVKLLKPDFAAWVFPPNGRKVIDSKWYYPGGMVVGKLERSK